MKYDNFSILVTLPLRYQDQMTLQELIGRTLGHYRIVEQIGAGGMGVVYRAHDERLDRDVAVKVLPEEVSGEAERLKRFEREAKALAALSHPNIATIHGLESGTDADSDAGQRFLVMELLEGESLRELIAKGNITTGKAVEYARAIADGLAAAHSKGIVHRDLKPENVFLTGDGRIKILDFGLAKLRLPEAELTTETPTETLGTATGTIMGTVAYMAPEQVQGQPADHRSDIFALGVVLYEMLTGKRPFSGSTSVETAAAILKEDPEPISAASTSISPALARVVTRCLEKRPEDRFSSAHDLSITLGTIDTTGSAPAVGKGTFVVRRWPHVLAIAIAAVIGLFVILPPEAIFDRLTGTPEAPPIRSIAVLPFDSISGIPEQEFLADGMTEALITDLAAIGGFDKVISRTSVVGLKNTGKTMPEIAEALGVDAVVEGSVQRSGDRIRVTIQLIHAPSDRHLWAESFDRNLDDILGLQSDLARRITKGVAVALTEAEERRLAEGQQVDPSALEAYLKARYSPGLKRAEKIALLEHSVVIDPTFAPAYVQLGLALDGRFTGFTRGPEEVRRSREMFLKAIELEPESAEAHAGFGRHLYAVEWDWLGAEAELKRALALAPNNLSAHWGYASLMAYIGRFDESIATAERAVLLDPLSVGARNRLMFVNALARRHEDYLRACKDAAALSPESDYFQLSLADAYSLVGRNAEAFEALQRAEILMGDRVRDPVYFAYRSLVCGRIGESQCAVDALNQILELRQNQRVSPVTVSQCYLAVGDHDRALDWIEKAFDEHDGQLIHIAVNQDFDQLRDEPRFQAIVEKMNFPPN